MNCRVVVEAAVPVYDVETPDEAVRIAISKTGEMLNPDLNYVEINMGGRACPHCGEELEPAFIAADESLVALELEMTVFNVEREEHASRIARKEIGQRLENIPLDVIEIEVLEEEDDDSTETDAEDDSAEAEDESAEEVEDDGSAEAEDDDSAEAEDESAEEVEDDDGSTDETDATDDSLDEDLLSEESTDDAASADDTADRPADTGDDDEVLPEFEELIDE